MLNPSPSPRSSRSAVLIGTGPAALLLAAALQRRGLPVTLVGPDPEGGFAPTYAMFADEVAGTPLEPAVRARWERVQVRTNRAARVLEEPYVRLDSRRAAEVLRDACSGCTFLDDRVMSVERRPEGLVVSLASGERLEAHRVIDASGHHPVAIQREPARHVQIALGGTLRGQHGLRTPLLMDFRGMGHQPTFLYALPISASELFVEETVLVTASPPSLSTLERRLRRRLERMGLAGTLEIEERCLIPMDPGLPDPRQPVLGFGAAASLVHPATGYQLAACLQLADPLAEALAATWDRPLDEAAASGWSVLWPSRRRRVRELQQYGARFAAELDRADQARFFEAFFTLPPRLVRAYLGTGPSVWEIAQAMARVFVALPSPLRWRLVQRGASEPLPLILPLVGV